MNNESERISTFKEIKALSFSDKTIFIGLDGNKSIEQDGVAHLRQIYHFPILHLYELIALNEEDNFNQELENYIENKKADIIKTEKNDDPRYWIDFDLMGVLAEAERNSFKINLETDYAPVELFSKHQLGKS